MNRSLVLSPTHAAAWIARGVFIELTRRKDLYVFGLLIIVFCIGALAMSVAGVKNPATGTFLLNLGMTLAYVFAHILTLLLAARQIPSEMESRTIYPILARPIARTDLLLGKWFASTLCGILAYVAFFLLVWIATPRLEAYSFPLLVQSALLQTTSLGLTAALAILMSLLIPKGLTVVLLGAAVFGGNMLLGIVQSAAAGKAMEALARWFTLYLPDFSKLNLTTRYTDGIKPLSGSVFLGLVTHGVFYIVAALGIGHIVFRRRPL